MKNKKMTQHSFSKMGDESEQMSILSSNQGRTPRSVKNIGLNIQRFVDELEFETKNTLPISSFKEFDRIHKLNKEDK